MEKFLARNIIAGHSQTLGIKKVQLILPNAKHYALHAVKNGEDVLREETLLEGACSRKTSEVYQYFTICLQPHWRRPSTQNSPVHLIQKPIPSITRPSVAAQ